MARPNLAIVLGFILGAGFMLPFTLAFRAPAAAEPTITLQGLAERLAKTEAAIAQGRSTTTLADTVVAMGSKLDTLQSRVGSFEKATHENEATTAAALKALQDDAGNAKAAIGILNLAANINGKNSGGNTLQDVAADLAALKKAFGGHVHLLFSQSQIGMLTMPTLYCGNKATFIPDFTCSGTGASNKVLTFGGGVSDFQAAVTGAPK